MKQMFNYLKAKLYCQKGQGMVEYALLVALIAIVVIAALVILGPIIRNQFTDIGNSLTTP